MKRNLNIYIVLSLCVNLVSNAQFSSELKSYLKQHISTLASDTYEGRGAGTKGEALAAAYISNQFKQIGLTPSGDSLSYFQFFNFTSEAKVGKNNKLIINGKAYKPSTDFYPLSYSSNTKLNASSQWVTYGISAKELGYNDYKDTSNLEGCIFIMELSSPDGADPHTTKYNEYIDIRKKIEVAISKGAKGILFINSDKNLDNPGERIDSKIYPSEIPVIFATTKLSKKLKKCNNCIIELETEIVKSEKTARNVLGYIDNQAATTVIIGAHYDHLGWHHSGSLHSGKDSAIHNGADDNASGIAGLIELASSLKTNSLKNNNYLFIAFSGEESGLLGSSHFVNSSLFQKYKINYMLNMDMIGRLDTTEKKLIVNGSGTSPIWAPLLNSIKPNAFSINTSESGVGPSDHTSFYLKDVPVLHFFSGLHLDYHKPSDDEEKVNYNGMESILQYMGVLIDSLNTKGKLEFTKTKDQQAKATPKFSVTLGVMPDYSYNGKGLKITGVVEEKPAQQSGLQAHDIIVKIDEYTILDIYSYMEALSKFKKGEKTTIQVLRNNQEFTFPLEW